MLLLESGNLAGPTQDTWHQLENTGHAAALGMPVKAQHQAAQIRDMEETVSLSLAVITGVTEGTGNGTGA